MPSNSAFEHEKNKWERWFSEALKGTGQENEQGFFWQYSENDSRRIISDCMAALSSDTLHIAELACGAGRVSISMAQDRRVADLSLLDGSQAALDYAHAIMPEDVLRKTTFINGNLLKADLPDNSADLVWNCGVIEHYGDKDMRTIISEMYRVTRVGGCMVIAIPNRNSLAALKAYVLGKSRLSRYLKWVPGYRYDSEILYSNREISLKIKAVTGSQPSIEYAGSPAWVTAPIWITKTMGWTGKALGCSFLSYFVTKKQEPD